MLKKGSKIISVYWFFILFIVAAAVAYMVYLFYGTPYDIREIEARILTNQIADCISEGGYLRGRILEDNFTNNFLDKCNLNFDVEDIYDWKKQGQYYAEVNFHEFDESAPNSFGKKILGIVNGNENLKTVFLLGKSEEKRKKGRNVDTIVIHYTAGYTAKDAIEAIKNRDLSIHYMIDRDGFIISKDNADEIVEKGSRAFKSEDKAAAHAGCPPERTLCKGERPKKGEVCCVNVNPNSIGIELVNLGDVCKVAGDRCKNKIEIKGKLWEAFSDEQIDSLVSLVADIISRYYIPVDRWHIIGHEEVAPGYKFDPGPAFPWEEFMRRLMESERLSPSVGRSFYVIDKKDDKQYSIKILAIIGKREKNAA